MLLFVAKSFGQKAVIYGSTASGLSFKYAYLYDPDTKILLTAPLSNYQFSFNLDRSEKLKILMLSFSSDLMYNYGEILESPDYKYPNGVRMVALEDSVEVTLKQYPRHALVKGKDLNTAIDGMYASMKSMKFATFFEQYPDSPVAIVFLKTLTNGALKGVNFFNIIECRLAYDKLSDRLKNTEEGKALFKLFPK